MHYCWFSDIISKYANQIFSEQYTLVFQIYSINKTPQVTTIHVHTICIEKMGYNTTFSKSKISKQTMFTYK